MSTNDEAKATGGSARQSAVNYFREQHLGVLRNELEGAGALMRLLDAHAHELSEDEEAALWLYFIRRVGR